MMSIAPPPRFALSWSTYLESDLVELGSNVDRNKVTHQLVLGYFYPASLLYIQALTIVISNATTPSINPMKPVVVTS